MFAEPLLFLTIASLCLAGYWIIPSARPALRGWWLIGCSVWLLLAVAHKALLVVLVMTAITWAVSRLFDRWHSRIPLFASIALLCGMDLWLEGVTIWDVLGSQELVITLGVAVALLKSINMIVDAYIDGDRLPARQMLLLNLFFPIYAAGPIELPAMISDKALSVRRISAIDVQEGLLRMVFGWFKLAWLSAIMMDALNSHWPHVTTAPQGYTALSLLLASIAGFGTIYVNFSGYCDIAIGFCRLLGLKVEENFNHPWLAHNIQNFWQRWHISLGRFVVRNIYAPSARRGWRQEPMIVLAFVLVGIWHHLSGPFIVWGIINGLGFAWARWLDRASKRGPDWWKMLRASPPYRAFAVVLTITFLAVVSRFARMPDLATGGQFLATLLGGGP